MEALLWSKFFEYENQLSAQKYGQYGPGITTPDMDDVKESVKQGVSKVAGRLSGMASGVMTQLQVRYKYLNVIKSCIHYDYQIHLPV